MPTAATPGILCRVHTAKLFYTVLVESGLSFQSWARILLCVLLPCPPGKNPKVLRLNRVFPYSEQQK